MSLNAVRCPHGWYEIGDFCGECDHAELAALRGRLAAVEKERDTARLLLDEVRREVVARHDTFSAHLNGECYERDAQLAASTARAAELEAERDVLERTADAIDQLAQQRKADLDAALGLLREAIPRGPVPLHTSDAQAQACGGRCCACRIQAFLAAHPQGEPITPG